MRYSSLVLLVGLGLASVSRPAHGEGEAVAGFPNWTERVMLEWTNRARSDPQADLAGCSAAACPDKSCYSQVAARSTDPNLLHSARFHAAHQSINGYTDYFSHCVLNGDVGSTYPQTCDGSASCSCSGGTITSDSSFWTNAFNRMTLFGATGDGETNAPGLTDPNDTFYAMLYNPGGTASCPSFSYRSIMLNSDSNAGAGFVDAGLDSHVVMDFGYGGPGIPKIPSAAHYPRQAATIDAWANWYDSAGPSVAKLDLDGACSDMTLDRGSQTNGAWHSAITTAGSGCHHYVFAFKDSGGAEVLYPTTGALTIGDGSALCPDFSRAPPPGCAGFDRIFVNGLDP